jgi:hypothetical protein
MIEIMYSTPKPERDRSESFLLVLTSRKVNGQRAYAFMEEHGQWNPELNRYVHQISSILADEGTTFNQARELYQNAKSKLAERGFVHSFAPLMETPKELKVADLELVGA